MQVIDLSQTIQAGMQIYAGDPIPSIEKYLTHEQDHCHVDRLLLGSHSGTHIDAPFHFLQEGKRISEFGTEKFIKPGIIIDLQDMDEQYAITTQDIAGYIDSVQEDSVVILMTGWDRYFGSEKYSAHPFLSPQAAEILTDKKPAIIGIDALNIDPTLQEKFPVHDILLSRGILIVENLCNLNSISSTTGGLFSFLPLKLQDTDGSPIRAVFIKQEN